MTPSAVAFFQIAHNVPYKNSAAIAGDDFPQENQTQQVRKEFRFKTGFSIVFIQCCELGFFSLLVLIRNEYLFPRFSRVPKISFKNDIFDW